MTNTEFNKQSLMVSVLVQILVSNLGDTPSNTRVAKKMLRTLKKKSSTFARTITTEEFRLLVEKCNEAVTFTGKAIAEQLNGKSNIIDVFIYLDVLMKLDPAIYEGNDKLMEEFKHHFYSQEFSLSVGAIQYALMLHSDVTYYLKHNHANS